MLMLMRALSKRLPADRSRHQTSIVAVAALACVVEVGSGAGHQHFESDVAEEGMEHGYYSFVVM